jgi:hypothetical protein
VDRKLGVTIREKHRLRVFENRVLIEAVTGVQRELHDEELHNLFVPQNVIRVTK